MQAKPEPYNYFYLDVKSGGYTLLNRNIRFTSNEVQREIPEPPSFDPACDTVSNFSFETDTSWLISGQAVITNGALSLSRTSFSDSGLAAQNLYLDPGITYEVVISISNIISGPVTLNVQLADASPVVFDNVSSGGIYTTTLTTPGNIFGPQRYALWAQTYGATIDVDYTCLYQASAGPGGDQVDCIAPTNGNFDDDDSWEWYRGALWQAAAKNALLPVADQGMIQTPVLESFEVPDITEDEFLLLGFNAAGLGNNGGLFIRAWGLHTDNMVTTEVYPTTYRFEFDISALALADDYGNIAFVNPGPGAEALISENDVEVDNICIWVSDRPPNLPIPIDQDGIIPVDFGFNFTSCADIDMIWAGFGVNMAQHRSTYQDGFPWWTAAGLLFTDILAAVFLLANWIITIAYVTLADWSCLFMAAFSAMVNLIEYIINNLLNIWNYIWRLIPALLNIFLWFMSGWIDWIATTIWNLGMFIRHLVLNWWNWVQNSWLNVITWIGNTLSGWYQWLVDAWDWVTLWVDGFFSALKAWFVEQFRIIFDIYDFALAVGSLISLQLIWIWANFIAVGNIPLGIYNGFNLAFNSAAYNPIISCSGANFWCVFLGGVQLINQVASHSILYPIVIVCIILGTIVILWRDIKRLFTEIAS